MDTEHFDDLVKTLQTARLTRGGALRGLATGAAALLGARVMGDEAEARRRRHRHHRHYRKGVSKQAVTFDPQTGTGFVGKGDVQLTCGWNNAQLQNNAVNVRFRANSTVITERSWVCTNSNNQNSQERERTTTTSIQGVLFKIDRLRNQITGFILNGYNGAPTQSSTTDGPPLNSCPSGPWALTSPAGDPVEVSHTTVVEVACNGTNFQPIQSPA